MVSVKTSVRCSGKYFISSEKESNSLFSFKTSALVLYFLSRPSQLKNMTVNIKIKNDNYLIIGAEYNRVFKCLHLLDYADDEQLRQVIQESLNRGEQLQGLKRALAVLGGNQFRGRNPEEMARWNRCADLLANCIVYYKRCNMNLLYYNEISTKQQCILFKSC